MMTSDKIICWRRIKADNPLALRYLLVIGDVLKNEFLRAIRLKRRKTLTYMTGYLLLLKKNDTSSYFNFIFTKPYKYN